MTKRPQNTEVTPLERRFFIVGCVCLAVAIGLVVAAFVIQDLSLDQRVILRWVCSLAAGFAAGSFAGTLAVRSTGLVPGLVLSATGGFGVFLLVFFFLFPSPQGTTGPPPVRSLTLTGTTEFGIRGIDTPPRCFTVGVLVELLDKYGPPLKHWTDVTPARKGVLTAKQVELDSGSRTRPATGEQYYLTTAVYAVDWTRELVNDIIAVPGSDALSAVAWVRFTCTTYPALGSTCDAEPYKGPKPDLESRTNGSFRAYAVTDKAESPEKLFERTGQTTWSSTGPNAIGHLAGPELRLYLAAKLPTPH